MHFTYQTYTKTTDPAHDGKNELLRQDMWVEPGKKCRFFRMTKKQGYRQDLKGK
jgi:hypothetical protein